MLRDELKTVITLSCNRQPHLEREIFADKELTSYYLRALASVQEWHVENDDLDDIVRWYARDVIKGRWPEAEHIIRANCGYWINQYCSDHNCRPASLKV